MLSFALAEEQQALRELAREFALNEIAPVAAELDRNSRHPQALIEKAHALGLMNLTVPEAYGGGDLGAFEDCLVAEELGTGCAGVTTTLLSNSLALTPIVLAGTPAQLEAFVAPVCAAPKLASFCLTEPNAGSDVASIRTRYHREGDAFVINGTKHWITNGGESALYVVFATRDPALRHEGISVFIVPADTPGLKFGKKEDKMGQRASTTREVIFDNVHVPAANRLGQEGDGWMIAMRTLDKSRPGVAALAVGIARAALQAALTYSQQRHQFGRPISEFQGIQFMLADMAIKIETARNQVWKSAWLVDHNQPSRYDSSIAKCYATDMAMQVTTDAVQIFGGYGYSREYPVEKYMRDAKLMQIYEGTNQIQRIVISRALLKGEAVV
ncbi:MAG: acyl-CoA dehydrogenase family protein [Ardenticatenaceae bacterium]|nr:acyl-CoA dehydrogenase family protein [Ardenticatenaceae bacterium]HBY95310.1 acyl-CoA dehydrogenase [Chloroflexota bacterium]